MKKGFLARWSQRKRAAATSPAAAPAPSTSAAETPGTAIAPMEGELAPATPPPDAAAAASPSAAVELPAVEELTLESDFALFMRAEVSEALRRQALKKLFADPHFNRMDGLDIYIDDYSIADPIPPAILDRLGHAREWLWDDRAAEAEADRATNEASRETTSDATAAPQPGDRAEEAAPASTVVPPAAAASAADAAADAAVRDVDPADKN